MNQEKFTVNYERPECLLKPMKLVEKVLMGPGPSNFSERVLKSLYHQPYSHLRPETYEILDEVKSGIKYIFQTKNTLTLALSAAGHSGIEAAIANLLERGETLLIVKNGFWGERITDIANRNGINAKVLEVELGTACTYDELEKALKLYRPNAVFIVHSESSVGLRQPLDGFGDLVHKYDALLIVDAVASIGIEPFYTDAWGVDIVYTGSQKGLSAPAGITPITFSPLAEKKIFSRKTQVPVFYWDVTVLGIYWDCFSGEHRPYHHTISTTLLFGLREALAQIASEGLPAVWARHSLATERLHRGLHERGLELFVKNREHRLKAITAIKIPSGINEISVLKKAMELYNVEIARGMGPSAGLVFRIGVMGTNATPERVDLALKALDAGLRNSKI